MRLNFVSKPTQDHDEQTGSRTFPRRPVVERLTHPAVRPFRYRHERTQLRPELLQNTHWAAVDRGLKHTRGHNRTGQRSGGGPVEKTTPEHPTSIHSGRRTREHAGGNQHYERRACDGRVGLKTDSRLGEARQISCTAVRVGRTRWNPSTFDHNLAQ